jgi:hypothetical protein
MTAAKNLKPWQPGQSGNPGGRPKLPEVLRGIASLSQSEVCKLVSKYARMTRDELQQAIQAPSTPVLEMAIASIFAQSIKQGDYTRLSFLLDRAIGKVREVSPDDESADARTELRVLSTEELLRLVQATTQPSIDAEKK